MDFYKDKVLVSFSTLKQFKECPKAFLYAHNSEPFTDARRLNTVLSRKDTTLLSQLVLNREKDMATISLDDNLGGHMQNVSASSLGQFKKCKKAFKYRITKTPYSDRIALTNFQFGSLVHTNFDKFAHGLIDEYGSLLKAPFREAFIEWYKSDDLKQAILAKLGSTDEWNRSKKQAFKDFYVSIKNQYQFVKSILDQGCNPEFNFWLGTVKNPLEFTGRGLNHLRFIGELDIFYINQRGNFVIEDFKTSNSTFYLDSDQLYLYAMAMEQISANNGNDRKVEALNFDLVTKGFRHAIPFGEDQRESLLATLQSLETCLELDDFPAIKGRHCDNCAWRSKCARENFGTKAQKAKLDFIQQLKSNASHISIADLCK